MTQTDSVAPSLPDLDKVWETSLGWQPTSEQQQQFQRIYSGILSGNQQMNLTRITAPAEFWEKHLWDSLSGLAPWLQPLEQRPNWAMKSTISTVLDIGTGAGLPGLPAAIAQPTWQVTLMDATQKKIRFLQELVQAIGFANAHPLADRAEFLAHQPAHREHYDLTLVRAVGPVATCAEYALPLTKVGGLAILYRGQWTNEDEQSLAQATHRLGGNIIEVRAWQTPLTGGARHCVYVQKLTPTSDRFPRAAGIPAKQPLA